MKVLQEGPLFKFSDWPNDLVPDIAIGVYTVWHGDMLLYAGMSGRELRPEQLEIQPGQPRKPQGLWTRLRAHASGRRSGDQFNVYICDRLVIPTLTPEQQADLGRGHLSLDQLTRDYIRKHLGYRFLTCTSASKAREIESVVRAGGLRAGPPYLNPLRGPVLGLAVGLESDVVDVESPVMKPG
ncbi:hypothetical protein ACFO0F_56385 [Nonomuraea zeae]